MECDEAKPLLAAHALGALGGDERSSLEEHVAGCPACQGELEEDRKTAQRLPFAVTVKEPPPSLKAKLMARIAALEAAQAPEPAPAAHDGPRSARRWSIWGRRPVFAAAASLAAVAAFVVGWSLYQTDRVNAVKGRNEELRITVHALEGRNQQLATTMKAQWSLLGLATDPRVAAAPFRGSTDSPNTWGTLLVNREDQQAVVMVVDLSPPTKGEVYQVWLWEAGTGQRMAVGTFRTWEDGYGMWRFQPPANAANLRFGISREPEGGSPWPTSAMLVSGALPGDR